MKCPNCGADIRNNAAFCGTCGQRVNYASSQTSNTGQTVASGTLTPGSHLQNNRYIVKKILGQGGMGAALLATDARLDDKPVVIKELISDSADPTQRQEDVRNFRREVSTLARIDHPLVPNVTDHFQEGSRYFMVQEYVDGQNLEDYLDSLHKPMSEKEVLVCASEILDILDYLSQQTPPIVHRDIKPANIIIGKKDRRGHLVDFGIARADEIKNAQRKQTSALGTPGYAPPEQYQGNADQRSDLYALAATLHHLLTNRDPRNYPPFAYPPARTLNNQITPETEQILTRALNNDITQRYQDAQEMKQDIDNVLRTRFNLSRNIDTYTLGASGPINAVSNPYKQTSTTTIPTQPAASTAFSQTQATQLATPAANMPRQATVTPVQPLIPSSAPYPQQPYGQNPQGNQQPRRRNPLLFVLAILIVIALIASSVFIFSLKGGSKQATKSTQTTAKTTPTATAIVPIGATMINGEPIGISDGTTAFNTTLADGNLKTQAAQQLKQNPDNPNAALSTLNQALRLNENDAEALIYQEDLNVLKSRSPYVTFVVATMLSGSNVGVGADDLQGAYVAQKEYNDGARLQGGLQVRLLIANAGNSADNVNRVAQQIIALSKQDKTFAGVMGWPFSAYTQSAVAALKNAHIPLVSQTASSDALSGSSPYFFRIVPSNVTQGEQGALYAENTLHAHNIALFDDPSNSYSQSLANDFRKAFTQNSQNHIVDEEKYTIGQPGTITAAVQNALTKHIDAIYFSGYASDVSTILTNLPAGNLPVLGGDALYELGGYSASARPNLSHLRFTTFAYPDEWDVLKHGNLKPSFFTDYGNYFNSDGSQPGGKYGFTRPTNDVMLSYDATVTLLSAYNNVLSTKKQSITPMDESKALSEITGSHAIQGVSGQIAFDAQGDPINKAIVVLYVDSGVHFHMDPTPLGQFLKSNG